MRVAAAVLDEIWGLGENKMSFGWNWSVIASLLIKM